MLIQAFNPLEPPPKIGHAFITHTNEVAIATDGNEDVTAYALEIGEMKVMRVEVLALVVNYATQRVANGTRAAFFGRGNGNIIRFAQEPIVAPVNTFTGVAPSFRIEANNLSDPKTFELILTGRAGESLNWSIGILARENR